MRGADKQTILAAFAERIERDPEAELAMAISRSDPHHRLPHRGPGRIVSASDTPALGERAQAMIDALATISAEPDKLTRLFLSPEHKRAAALVGEWMRRAGLTVRMDAVGTMHGLLPAGRDGPRAHKRLLVGSHLDTVVDGGRFDGNLGIVAGIVAAEEIARPRHRAALRARNPGLRRRGGRALSRRR